MSSYRQECESEKELISEIAEKSHTRIDPQDDKKYDLYSFSAYDNNQQTPIGTPGSEINSAKYNVPSQSVLISKLNPRINRVWKVEDAETNAICSTEFIVLQPRENTPLDYLYAVLNNPSFRSHLTQLTTGTSGSHQRVKQTDILDYEISRFNRVEKRVISSIYGNLDKKIDINNQINGILEEMAQAIFKSWFIDFERYNEFKNSELGEIPAEFKVRMISEFAEIILGNSPKSEHYNEKGDGLPFFQGSKNFGLRYPETERWCTKRKKIAEEDDVLISIRAPVGDVNRAMKKSVVGRGVTAIRMKQHSNEFLYHLLKSKKQEWEKYKSGTTFNSINKTDIQEFPVAMPPSDEISRFNNIVGSMATLFKKNVQEKNILVDLRDTLLPKLMSGEIRVNDIDLDTLGVDSEV